MKVLPKILLICILNLLLVKAYAQTDTLLLSPKMFEDDRQQIFLSNLPGWRFHPGHNPAWAAKNFDATQWTKMKPTQLNMQHADRIGRLEAWFRINIEIDSSFKNMPLGFRKGSWVAMDLYVDGKKLKTYGNTGKGDLYRENSPVRKYSISYPLVPNKTYAIAIHIVDYPDPLRRNRLKVQADSARILRIAGPAHNQQLDDTILGDAIGRSISLSISILLSLLLVFLAFINQEEKHLKLMAITAIFFSIMVLGGAFYENRYFSFVANRFHELINPFLVSALFIWFPIVLAIQFKLYQSKWLQFFIYGTGVLGFILIYFNPAISVFVTTLGSSIIAIYICLYHWKTIKGAEKAFTTGVLITLISTALAVLLEYFSILNFGVNQYLLFLAFPLCMLVYVLLRFKENLLEIQENAQKIVQFAEEKKEQAIQQQKILEAEVSRQTEALRHSLENLRTTQAQLIQSEKLASLGELTAGIAHEIQNPLNFVNNFAEVSTEMLDEMHEELERGDTTEAIAIATDLKTNLEKINHHGQRASSIVKGMLEHSRASTGVKEPTDLNALADEYLRLAYHGLRAKDNNFNATLETHFDPDLPKVSVIPQDIGRVLLNLINNAFYAATEKAKEGIEGYKPTVTISSQKLENAIEIRVEDNGNGIPEAIKDKIFHPFFTTKPTGQGTGLGLSLTYDIVTKGHGGKINFLSTTGQSTTFSIWLPITV